LNALRSKHPAIRYGSRRSLRADQDQYAVVRAYLQDRVLILYNRSEKPARFDLDLGPEFSDGPLKDNLSQRKGDPTVKNGFLKIELPGLSSAILTP